MYRCNCNSKDRMDNKKKNNFDKKSSIKRDCLFKLSYLDLEHQLLGNKSTAQRRIEMGSLLAKRYPVKNADIVVPMPETSIFNAQGFANESKLPLVYAIAKKRPKPKTLFTKNRKKKIKNIFFFIPNLFKNKKVVIVDETVISGLSLKTILSTIRSFKPKEIHIRVVCKPMMRKCPSNNFSKKWKFAPRNYKKYFNVESFEYLNNYDLESFAECSYCFGNKQDNSIKFNINEKKEYKMV